jgi:hypothetical protein
MRQYGLRGLGQSNDHLGLSRHLLFLPTYSRLENSILWT